jgi:hypothetical protein
MNVTENSIDMEQLAERADREDRLSLIRAACQVFRRGGDAEAFTFKELRGACSFLSTLLGAFDRATGDLCLLASHAENRRQFEPIYNLSRRQWDPAML